MCRTNKKATSLAEDGEDSQAGEISLFAVLAYQSTRTNNFLQN
jgi:hypothetical protein